MACQQRDFPKSYHIEVKSLYMSCNNLIFLNAYLDIDYTDHGNPKTHPTVPHEHSINFDDDGNMNRGKEKEIKK